MNKYVNNRRSIRLKDYDYSQIGYYFLTVCVQKKVCIFGDVENNKMILSDIGKLANQCWLNIPQHFPNVLLHEYVVMPNHIHGIIEITNNENNDNSVGTNNNSPIKIPQCLSEQANNNSPLQKGTSRTIGSIIRGFKIGVTKQLHNDGFVGQIWQRNYYEHIVRNEDDYRNIVEYIINNPTNWEEDKLYNK